MSRGLVLIGASMGILILLASIVEHRFTYYDLKLEILITVIAFIFAGLGYWAAHSLIERSNVGEAEHIAGEHTAVEAIKADQSGLTQREMEILGCIAEGLTTRQIAQRLFISDNTVKSHTSSIYSKLNVSRRTAAVRKAIEMGMLVTKFTRSGDVSVN